MEKKTGFIHIYCGDGKGKTTAGMGLCIRAAGYGYQVLIYQFMKDHTSSERKILQRTENITMLDGLKKEKFSPHLTETERKERLKFYADQFRKVIWLAEKDYDVLFLDEVIYTIQAGLLDEKLVLEYLQNKPTNLEIILTGNTPSEAILKAADYVSEIKKIKHPYEKGQQARMGIER